MCGHYGKPALDDAISRCEGTASRSLRISMLTADTSRPDLNPRRLEHRQYWQNRGDILEVRRRRFDGDKRNEHVEKRASKKRPLFSVGHVSNVPGVHDASLFRRVREVRETHRTALTDLLATSPACCEDSTRPTSFAPLISRNALASGFFPFPVFAAAIAHKQHENQPDANACRLMEEDGTLETCPTEERPRRKNADDSRSRCLLLLPF